MYLYVFLPNIYFVKIGFKPIDYIGFFGILKGAYGVSEKIGFNRFLGRFNMKNRLERFFFEVKTVWKSRFSTKNAGF